MKERYCRLFSLFCLMLIARSDCALGAEELLDSNYEFIVQMVDGPRNAYLYRDSGEVLVFQDTVGRRFTVMTKRLNEKDKKHLESLRLPPDQKQAVLNAKDEEKKRQQAIIDEYVAAQTKQREAAIAAENKKEAHARSRAMRLQESKERAEREREAERIRLAFATIRGNMETMTEIQFEKYAKSLKGETVVWSGWAADVERKLFGKYVCHVDMDSPDVLFTVPDVVFETTEQVALGIVKNKRVSFRGKIKSVKNVIVVCRITLEDVDWVQF